MSDTIYNRLLAGESIDDIMNQFAEEANEAQKRLEEERKAREAETADRKKELISLLDSALSWITRHFPALGIKEEDWDDEDLEVMAGLVIAILNAEAGKKATKILSTDEVFDKFFGTFGLKS